MRLNTASSTGLILLILSLCSGGCTTTEEVVESWRGQPIEAVVQQWGPPGWYETADYSSLRVMAYDYRYQTRSHEQPIQEGANTYSWTYTSHTFHPERCEVKEYKDGDKTYKTTRIIPAHWSTCSDSFYLTTNDAGRINGGGSSYEQNIWPLNKISKKRKGWGSLRRGWNAEQVEQVAAE